MNFLKMAALIVVAALPLLLSRKDKEPVKVAPVVESDHLFDEELLIG